MESELSQSNSTEKGWATFGKISAVVILVCTILGTLFAIYSYFAAKPDLEVYVSSGKFRLPPILQKEDDQTPTKEFFSESYDGYFEVIVKNEGGVQADNVVFDFPYEGVAKVIHEDGDKSEYKFNGKVTIGSIRPKKVAVIFLWTKSDPQSYKGEDIGITHTNGIGTIHFEKRVYGFWSAIFQCTSGWVWFVIYMLVVTPVVSYGLKRLEDKNKLKKQAAELEDDKISLNISGETPEDDDNG